MKKSLICDRQKIDDNNITGVSFIITNAKLFVPISTLSINDNTKFLKKMKQGVTRTVSWKKYRSEITTLSKEKTIQII